MFARRTESRGLDGSADRIVGLDGSADRIVEKNVSSKNRIHMPTERRLKKQKLPLNPMRTCRSAMRHAPQCRYDLGRNMNQGTTNSMMSAPANGERFRMTSAWLINATDDGRCHLLWQPNDTTVVMYENTKPRTWELAESHSEKTAQRDPAMLDHH